MTAQHLINAFLRRIMLRMKSIGLTNSALARRIGVTRAYVGRVLKGDVNISFGTALKLAKALKMDFVPELRECRCSATCGEEAAE